MVKNYCRVLRIEIAAKTADWIFPGFTITDASTKPLISSNSPR